MHREGHIGAALAAYAPLGTVVVFAGFDAVALVGGVAAVGLAMLPDYDQQVPGIEHRGVTHTVWFALVVGVCLGVAGAFLGDARGGPVAAVGLGAFGFLVGVTTVGSHIAADALTPMGVTPFAPLDKRHISYNVARAANPLANYALLAVGVAVAGGGYALAVSLTG